MTNSFQRGDTVRVRNPDNFLSLVVRKLTDRDAIVLWVGPHNGGFHNRAKVRFAKRNGRGKEFELILRVDDLEPWPNRDASAGGGA